MDVSHASGMGEWGGMVIYSIFGASVVVVLLWVKFGSEVVVVQRET